MSFRRRFALILCLVVTMVAMAAIALNQLRTDGDSRLEAAAVSAADGLVDALLRRAADDPGGVATLLAQPRPAGLWPCRGAGCDGPPKGPSERGNSAPSPRDDGPPPFGDEPPFPGRPPPDPGHGPPPLDDGPEDTTESAATASPLALRVDELLTTVPRSSGGYCGHDGTLLLQRYSTSGSPPHRLFIADLDLARRACARAVATASTQRERREMPNEVLLVSARAASDQLVAWSLTRMPPHPTMARRGGLLVEVAGMTIVCLLLVALTLDGWRTLRGGTRDLELGLVRLRADLRAEIALPRPIELARVAEGLRAMASDLADTQSRERTLERRLGHEQRLAGLGRVVAGVAHEVRNPITGIKLKLDGLVRRGVDDRARADIQVCLDEIARLDRVVSSLLMVARKASTEKETFDLERLLDERIVQAGAEAAARRVRVERRGSAVLMGNRETLTAVVDNLLRNALEASPEGGIVELVIELRETRHHVLVHDQGEGIPDSRQGELFEPFFTLKPTGTGLGLFLSRSLLLANGGGVTYRRDAGVTTFDVELP